MPLVGRPSGAQGACASAVGSPLRTSSTAPSSPSLKWTREVSTGRRITSTGVAPGLGRRRRAADKHMSWSLRRAGKVGVRLPAAVRRFSVEEWPALRRVVSATRRLSGRRQGLRRDSWPLRCSKEGRKAEADCGRAPRQFPLRGPGSQTSVDTGVSLAALALSGGADLHLASLVVKETFYNVALPRTWQWFFCLLRVSTRHLQAEEILVAHASLCSPLHGLVPCPVLLPEHRARRRGGSRSGR